MSGLRQWDIKMSEKEREELKGRLTKKVRILNLCEKCNELKEDTQQRKSQWSVKAIYSCEACFKAFEAAIYSESKFGWFEND